MEFQVSNDTDLAQGTITFSAMYGHVSSNSLEGNLCDGM